MHKKTLTTVLIIVLIVILGAVVFAAMRDGDANYNGTTTDDVAGDTTREVITAQHQYQPDEGVHVIAGEIEVPTPCHNLNIEIMNEDEDASEVTVAFEVEQQGDEDVCAQVVQVRRYMEVFSAPEDAEITATYNGNPAQLNLMPVGPDENLEDFQVYMKG